MSAISFVGYVKLPIGSDETVVAIFDGPEGRFQRTSAGVAKLARSNPKIAGLIADVVKRWPDQFERRVLASSLPRHVR